MELFKLISIILFAVSLAVQAVNFAAQGTAVVAFQASDNFYHISTTLDSHSGTYQSVFILTGISTLCYIYLLIVKILDKSPSMIVDWVVWMLVVIFQFGIAIALSVALKNNKTMYEALISTIDSKTGEQYNLLVDRRNSHNLTLAAAILDFVLCFTCEFILLIISTKNIFDDIKVSSEKLKGEASVSNIVQ